jgi:site-specific recombinase XerD
MSTQPFAKSEISSHPDHGPVARHLPAFTSFLSAQGYSDATLKTNIQVLRNFSKWCAAREVNICDLSEESLEFFLDDRLRAGYVRRADLSPLRVFLGYLRRSGVISEVLAATDHSGLHRVERDFSCYLTEERGLSRATLSNYLPVVHSFLAERFGAELTALSEISAADVTSFVLRHSPTMAPKTAQLMTTALRVLFRFLRIRGDLTCDLAACVPAVASWRLSSLPASLSPTEVKSLLQICDCETVGGQRDYAILLILARLGLRAGEVVAMELDDIDWESGIITIHGKGPRRAQLPIPQDVGAALVTYLCNGRPRCSTRRLFVRARAPRVGFSGSAAIDGIVSRALARTNINPVCKGAHLLRHSLATNMLRKGASLAEIGEILRHSTPNSTEIYAKVDLISLTALAQPWPGGEA